MLEEIKKSCFELGQTHFSEYLYFSVLKHIIFHGVKDRNDFTLFAFLANSSLIFEVKMKYMAEMDFLSSFHITIKVSSWTAITDS